MHLVLFATLLAVHVGKTRLIDNLLIEPAQDSGALKCSL